MSKKKKYELDIKKKIDIGGHSIKLHLVGNDSKNPAIIFLHGGPGVPNRDAVIRRLAPKWADFCTLLCYDQRGTGGSFKGTLDKDLTVQVMVEDLNAIVDFTLNNTNTQKIILLCGSWGTVIGLNYINKYPEKIYAYIGSGQMVNGFENERLSFEYALQKAKQANDEKSIQILNSVGPPVEGCYRPLRQGLFKQRQVLAKYGGSTVKPVNFFKSIMSQIFSSELSLQDKIGSIKGYKNSINVMWREIIKLDFTKDMYTFKVPIYILQGRHDYTTPSPLVQPWFDIVQAPHKELVWFEQSAHGPLGEEMDKYTRQVKKIIKGS